MLAAGGDGVNLARGIDHILVILQLEALRHGHSPFRLSLERSW
jgi:hypothetical protein